MLLTARRNEQLRAVLLQFMETHDIALKPPPRAKPKSAGASMGGGVFVCSVPWMVPLGSGGAACCEYASKTQQARHVRHVCQFFVNSAAAGAGAAGEGKAAKAAKADTGGAGKGDDAFEEGKDESFGGDEES